MNTSNILELVLSGFVMSFTCYYMWGKILNLKYNILSLKFILTFVLFGFSLFVNYYFNNPYVKICSATFFYFLVLRLLFVKNSKSAAITAIVTELIFIGSELLFVILFITILKNSISILFTNYFGAFISNFVICLISVGLLHTNIPKRIYNMLLVKTQKIKFSLLITILSIFIISLNLVLSFIYYKVSSITILVINIILTVIYSFIVFKFIEQKNRYIDISDKYSLSEASLKEVQNNVNRLMALNHENKNQLITIRTMVANKDKDVLKNIDAIVDEKIKDDKELKIRTSVISNTMLGSLIYSKLLTMKEKDITHNLHISKAINKSHLINLGDKTNVDICKIVGVYLDNAIEAVMEVDVKEINIDLYLEDAYFCISIANTFKGKVDLDAITDYGYTTKSNGHGYGLSLVKEVIKDNNALSSKTDIIDNKVFVQNLKIKM